MVSVNGVRVMEESWLTVYTAKHFRCRVLPTECVDWSRFGSSPVRESVRFSANQKRLFINMQIFNDR